MGQCHPLAWGRAVRGPCNSRAFTGGARKQLDHRTLKLPLAPASSPRVWDASLGGVRGAAYKLSTARLKPHVQTASEHTPPAWVAVMDVHPPPKRGQTYPEEGVQRAILHVLSHDHCQAAWTGKGRWSPGVCVGARATDQGPQEHMPPPRRSSGQFLGSDWGLGL